MTIEDWAPMSNKMQFIMDLLPNLFENNHRVAIFSRTKILLNLIEILVNIISYNQIL
jgi:SNF2 family DNA or RNA helicase